MFIPLSLLPVQGFPARAFSRIFLCSVKSSPLVAFDVVILSLFLMEVSYKRNHFYVKINIRHLFLENGSDAESNVSQLCPQGGAVVVQVLDFFQVFFVFCIFCFGFSFFVSLLFLFLMFALIKLPDFFCGVFGFVLLLNCICLALHCICKMDNSHIINLFWSQNL